ncbi:hypothetical protein MKX03_018038 [Papaver bracteatum]|nr:hypothetical protein MKX03_018038 [Papaver bracteatum]
MGANPETLDDSNCRPLDHAAMKDVILLLPSKGTDVDVTSDFGLRITLPPVQHDPSGSWCQYDS